MKPEPVADWIEGKYEILGKIREGGMGAVYKVRHRLLHEIRVIKIIRPQLDVGPELNERFLREARFAIQLRHPNIAQLHDFSIDDDGRAFIVMEYIEGVTLEDVIKTADPPPLGLALEIARQTLKGLGSMHRKGMIHRDVSPDNVMLSRNEDGEPRIALIDLGIAKALAGGSHLTTTGAFLGKPRYAAPEQFGVAGQDAVDTRSDLYSFGVVFYELLTGTSPIQGRDPSSLIAGHLFRPPVDFSESDPGRRVPADLRAVVLRMLAKEPVQRFQTAEQIDRLLTEIGRRYPNRSEGLELLLQAAAAAPAPGAPPPGTTQDRLDREFTASVTPAAPPASGTLYLGEVPRPVTPTPSPSPAPAAVVEPLTAISPPEALPLPVRTSSKRSSRLPWIAADAVLIVVIVAEVWWSQRPPDRQTPAVPAAPTVAQSPAPPPPAPVAAVQPSSEPLVAVAPTPPPVPAPTTPAPVRAKAPSPIPPVPTPFKPAQQPEARPEKEPVEHSSSSEPPGRPATAERTVLADSFEDNRHGWRASEHPSAPALVRDGHYILGSTAGGWRYATIDVDLPERGDFDISCAVTKLRGDDRYFFGLLWGFRDPNNFYNLAITGDGRAAVTAKSSGIFSNFNQPDVRCPAVHLANATNALRIVKKGTRLQFFVNGTEIHSMDWQWNGGFAPRLGLLAYGELLLAFDDLKISIPAPPQ
jgi:serine/threonine-protein kinase